MFIIKNTKIFLLIAIAIVAVSFAVLGFFGLTLGIDFTGGALTEVSYENIPEKTAVEQKLNILELGGYSLRKSVDEEGKAGYILRTRDLTETERQAVQDALALGGSVEMIPGRFSSIGPVIGEELKRKAVVAIGLVVLIIVLYIAFAFRGVSRPIRSWMYGLVTIIALAHDMLVPTAAFAFFSYLTGAEVNVLFVMALLAVLGYSVNDTIVVFDRIRENLLKNQENNQHEPFRDVVGRSLSQTFTRSVNTSLTTLFALLALYFLGGDIIKNFALVLIVGVVAGTYSSLFIASPLLVAIERWQRNRR